ncbi:Knottin scorpion toxin-like [Arabidopsis suecica]|uniref:Knottin scorpion toxin-like n=1 Tax=Arabidopsis suecica TaxID=45249 RepID=A0A8T2BQ46_ARASU|nr:Knottin scorpion toxin-like [Arabidopsis suecica]
MAKLATIIITVIFDALIKYMYAEAPIIVEAQKLCERLSGTKLGVCGNSNACKNRCILLEGARHGSCNFIFPYHRCVCYFPC